MVNELPTLQFSPFLEQSRPLLENIDTPVYVVGGAVRDALLGRIAHDVDLVVARDAIGLAFRLADYLGLPAYPLDDQRDIGRIVVPGRGITLDIARFRGQSLAEDLTGRDFTVNALALPVAANSADQIIDLHGGLVDIHERQLRIVHAAAMRDDPVRVLRAARLAIQLGFSLTGDTASAARKIAPLLPAAISAERIRDELIRLVGSGNPHGGLRLLHELGALASVLPEVAALDGLTQSAPHHEPVLAHTLSVLRYLVTLEAIIDSAPETEEILWQMEFLELLSPFRASLRDHFRKRTDGGLDVHQILRWGAVFHDIGKASTHSIDADGRIRFLGHDEAGATMAARRMTTLAFSNQAVQHVRQIVLGHMRPLYLAAERQLPSRRSIFRFFRAFPEGALDILILALADHLATYDGSGDADVWHRLLEVNRSLYEAYFHAFDEQIAPPRLLSGSEIINLLSISPGPDVGRLLRLLEEAQAAGEIHTEEQAIEFLRQHA